MDYLLAFAARHSLSCSLQSVQLLLLHCNHTGVCNSCTVIIIYVGNTEFHCSEDLKSTGSDFTTTFNFFLLWKYQFDHLGTEWSLSNGGSTVAYCTNGKLHSRLNQSLEVSKQKIKPPFQTRNPNWTRKSSVSRRGGWKHPDLGCSAQNRPIVFPWIHNLLFIPAPRPCRH